MSLELMRLVDSIARDKNIERENILHDLELAMASAARKHFDVGEEEVQVRINRETGEINTQLSGEPIDIKKLGRIPAQTAKQVMIQLLREDERGSIFAEYKERIGEMITGTVARFEGGSTVVTLGRTEAVLPRNEQIPGESHHPGERVRALIYDVKDAMNQVKVILSRTHPDMIRRLFEQEVPEVAEHIIEIKDLARKPGYRSKVAVTSYDTKVDAVGACVGVRGSRIKNIVDELGGEKIDIVRWNESSQILIGNALRPAEIQEIALCFELNRATVVVADDQLSLAIGKRGLNVFLAARLTGWDIEILTPAEYSKGIETLIKVLREIEGIDDTMIDQIVALGIVSVMDMEEVGVDPLVDSLQMDRSLAEKAVELASAEAVRVAAEKAKAASIAENLLSGKHSIKLSSEEAPEVSEEDAAFEKMFGDEESQSVEDEPAEEANETSEPQNASDADENKELDNRG